jgi:hypothetical protein
MAAAERLRERDDVPEALLTADLLDLHAQRLRMWTRQSHLAQRFTSAHPGVAIATVPAIAEDVHDLAGLNEIGDLLAAREN